ncbi:MAG: septal ring lytic transglycosylase RlpA family protein [Akkermansiaceae bacterium]|nr:septal ring lytic transglycosylase RlpA family protein [Akkermansiaceae bacterium]NNM29358.1 septal ring lytic transglycosylase RlpA family protein [Akkermansiaceae bacterium]
MNILRNVLMAAALFMVPAASASDQGAIYHGEMSWYCIECNGGTHTASGETLNDWAMTAAHKSLPLGTKVRVTNLENDRSVVVTINDRGPYIDGRIIDVTKGVAHKLDFVVDGVVDVKVEVL